MPAGSFDLGLIDQNECRMHSAGRPHRPDPSFHRSVEFTLEPGFELFDKDSFFIKAFFKVLRWQRMCEFARQRDTRMTYKRELWEFPEGFWGLFK